MEMTFILDINVYEEFILKLNKAINDAASLWGYKLISLFRPHAKKGPGSKALTGGHSTCHNEAAECQFSLLDSKEPSTTSLELHTVRTASMHNHASSAMESVSNSTQSGVAFFPLKQQPKSN